MIRRIFVTLGQEILIVCILLFVGYRVALIFDWIPENISPTGFIKQEYKDFKKSLIEDSIIDDYYGRTALILLKSVERSERYFAERKLIAEEQANISDECKSNAIMRFFMYGGKDSAENRQCTPKKLEIKKDRAERKLEPKDSAPSESSAPINPSAPINLSVPSTPSTPINPNPKINPSVTIDINTQINNK